MSDPPQPLGPFGGFDLSQMLRFLQSDGPVHWEVARQVARWVALEGGAEPEVPAADRARLAEVAPAAEQRVLAETGEAPPSHSLALLSRAEWADQALQTLRPVLEKLAVSLQGDLPDLSAEPEAPDPANPLAGMAGMLGSLGPLLLGVQCGFMVGQLAQGLLSEHDFLLPIADPPRPALIVPNLEAFHAAWSIPADDLRFYLALGEGVRSRSVARPWVRERLVRLASEYVSSFQIDTAALESQMGSIDFSNPSSFEGAMLDPDAMLGAMQSPEQMAVLERFQLTTAVLESYADTVVERLAEPMIKSLPTIREAMRRHQVERSEADRFIQRLLGLDPSRRLHDQAAAFCRGVEERATSVALDRLLEAEAMLPTPPELEAPGLWLARIDLFGGRDRMIVVMQPEATEADVEGVTAALARHGLVPSVSRGAECTVVGVIGDVDAAGDLSQFSILPGVDKTVRISAPYKLVSSREGHRRSTIRVGPTLIGGSAFALIAGPCAVETPEQAGEACEAAAKAGATVLRGDIYKHRTSPYAFQGLGQAGLEILAEQKARFGLPVVAEVLHPQEVDAMVDVVDIFRIGARNMQNFDLLRACSLTGKAVMLKRGLSATIEEWLLAAEYAASSGNLDIILCERGIRTFEPATRNTLDLSAVSVVQQRSHLPVIVDPSHGTGHKSLVAPMTLAAVAGGCDGIMIDVHPHPEQARCDGPQALLPDEFSALAERMWQLAAWMGRDVPPTVGSVERVS